MNATAEVEELVLICEWDCIEGFECSSTAKKVLNKNQFIYHYHTTVQTEVG